METMALMTKNMMTVESGTGVIITGAGAVSGTTVVPSQSLSKICLLQLNVTDKISKSSIPLSCSKYFFINFGLALQRYHLPHLHPWWWSQSLSLLSLSFPSWTPSLTSMHNTLPLLPLSLWLTQREYPRNTWSCQSLIVLIMKYCLSIYPLLSNTLINLWGLCCPPLVVADGDQGPLPVYVCVRGPGTQDMCGFPSKAPHESTKSHSNMCLSCSTRKEGRSVAWKR